MTTRIRFRPILPRNLKVVAPELFELSKILKDVLETSKRHMQDYPPPQTSYVRTEDLKKGWKVTRVGLGLGGSLRGRIYNDVKYARYVEGFLTMGDADQRQRKRFKELGWRPLDVVVDEELRKARPRIFRALKGRI